MEGVDQASKSVETQAPDTLRARLRAYREKHGLTQTQLARILTEIGTPVQISAISRVERGLRVHIRTRAAINRLLGNDDARLD